MNAKDLLKSLKRELKLLEKKLAREKDPDKRETIAAQIEQCNGHIARVSLVVWTEDHLG